jgi:hypothetical protein
MVSSDKTAMTQVEYTNTPEFRFTFKLPNWFWELVKWADTVLHKKKNGSFKNTDFYRTLNIPKGI